LPEIEGMEEAGLKQDPLPKKKIKQRKIS